MFEMHNSLKWFLQWINSYFLNYFFSSDRAETDGEAKAKGLSD